MRVLIAGCGYVGTALGERLAKDGHDVWGLRREVAGLPASIAPLRADLRDPRTLADLPSDLGWVVYAAAPDGHDDASYRDTYVRGLENLLGVWAARGERPARLVFVSSTSVYAQRDGGWVDEGSPTEPTHHSGRRLLEAEAIAGSGPGTSVVIRFAGIYGPGRTGLVEQVRRGEARVPAGGPRWTNRIHRDDCAGAIAHLLSLGDPAPLYLGVDDEPADFGEVVRWLAAELGAPEPSVEEPDAPRGGRFTRSSKRCSNARLRSSGYRFAYPTFRDGYRALLAGV